MQFFSNTFDLWLMKPVDIARIHGYGEKTVDPDFSLRIHTEKFYNRFIIFSKQDF
jgi:hypothetical protein